MTPTESDRMTALALLATFQSRVLPGALRRMAIWKSIEIQVLRDWLEDVEQDLAVDCLEHTDEILRLPTRQRHARWLRLVDRTIYRLRRQLGRQRQIVKEPYCEPPDLREQTLPSSLPHLVALNNGRANFGASMRRSGLARRSLRRQLDMLSERLGWDRERERFWQTRVVEALTGLAADLLREQHKVCLLATRRSPPDSARRLDRLQRLSERFPVQPSTLAVRRVLRPWHGRLRPRVWNPRRLLEQAVELDPNAGPPWLWLFEACCSEGDPAGAARALRRARRCPGVAPAATTLGRARLLELRGKLEAGLDLLRRAARRWPRDRMLRSAQAAAHGRIPN